MPIRFSEVIPNVLYRGGAPEDWEIEILKDVYGIEQIISLDQQSAKKIHNACKENDVQHIIIPIEDGINDKSNIIKEFGSTGIINNLNSYVHCYHGKDRTGLFVAKYRIENGWSFDEAMKEADSFGFGSGMSPEIVKNYIKIISDTDNKELCESCDMLNESENTKVDLNKLKKANDSIAEQSREEPSCYHSIDEAGDNRIVSDLFNVPEQSVDTATASYFRQSIIKYLMKKEFMKQAIDQDRITFKVPDREKKKGKLAIDEIDNLVENKIRMFIDHLDLMYEPFNEHKGITPDQAGDAAIHIDNFASVVEENLTKIKRKVYTIMKALEVFDSDTTIYSMLNSINDSINLIDNSVNSFVDILHKKESPDFQTNVIKAIEIIKKEVAQLKQLTLETIKDYLRDNIILENWTTEIEEEIVEEEQEQEIKEV